MRGAPFRAAAWILLLFAASLAARAEDFRYKPDDAVLATLTEEQGRDLLRQLFGAKPLTPGVAAAVGAARRNYWIDERGNTLSNSSVLLRRIEVLDDRLRLLDEEGQASEFAYHDLPEVESFDKSPGFLDHGATGVALNAERVLLISDNNEEPQTRALLRKLADALHVLKRASQGISPESDRQFAEAAARYRSSPDKPSFPEEARRFRVQAEAAVREKRMGDAARLYGSALKIVPWWPEGRFNRSLVLAEVGRYGEAISEMKRYLVLVPDAPNARAAQDKIYEWEAKAPAGR